MTSIPFLVICCLTIPPCYLSDLYFDHLKQCHREYHSCSSGSQNIYCRCDQTCVYYDDCCFDAKVSREQIKILNTEHRTFLNKTSCESYSKGRFPPSRGAFIVAACPELSSVQADVRIKCEQNHNHNVLDNIPVTDIKTNVTFKNRNCAICHGIQKWVSWPLDIKCGPSFYDFSKHLKSFSLLEILSMKLKSRSCSYIFQPPKPGIIRYCFHRFKYDIGDFMENKTTCDNRIFMPISYYRGTIVERYRTTQCLINEDNVNYLNGSRHVKCFIDIADPASRSNGNTLSSLIDLSALLRTHSNESQCGEKEIHLSNKIGCQLLYCPDSMEPYEGSCRAVRYTENGKLLDVLFEVSKVLFYEKEVQSVFRGVVKTILERLSRTCISYFPFPKVSLFFAEFKCIIGTNVFSGKACSVVVLRYPIIPNSYNNCSTAYERALVVDLLLDYNETLSSGVSFQHVSDVSKLSCNCNVSFNNPTYVMPQYESGDHLHCPAVKVSFLDNYTGMNDFNTSEIDTAIRHGTYFDLNGTIIDSSDVIVSNGDYFVCVDTFMSKYQSQSRQDSVHYRTIINAACTCMSLLCLLTFLIRYCAMPFMRNGKLDLILMLILFLLIAQMCFLIVSVLTITNEFCEWLGLLHHFSWLGTFVFMFLCSFRLLRELRNLKTLSRLENTMITVKYTCAGLGVIVLIVISTKITNLYLAPAEKWYGGRVCFISQEFVLLFSFILPICLILWGNIVIFVTTIYYITTTAISIKSKTAKPKVILFMKISTLMGFIWLLGIVAVLAESEVLLIIFENIASLQGMFITLSFACSYRNCKNCKTLNR